MHVTSESSTRSFDPYKHLLCVVSPPHKPSDFSKLASSTGEHSGPSDMDVIARPSLVLADIEWSHSDSGPLSSTVPAASCKPRFDVDILSSFNADARTSATSTLDHMQQDISSYASVPAQLSIHDKTRDTRNRV
jgi:hypothetical protein